MTAGCVVVNTFRRCGAGVIRYRTEVENSVYKLRARDAAPGQSVTFGQLFPQLREPGDLLEHVRARRCVPPSASLRGAE